MPERPDLFYYELGKVIAGLTAKAADDLDFVELTQFEFYKHLTEEEKAAWAMVLMVFFLYVVKIHADTEPHQFEICFTTTLECLGERENKKRWDKSLAIIEYLLAAETTNKGLHRSYLIRFYLAWVVWELPIDDVELLTLMASPITSEINAVLVERGFTHQLPMDIVAQEVYADKMHDYTLAIGMGIKGTL